MASPKASGLSVSSSVPVQKLHSDRSTGYSLAVLFAVNLLNFYDRQTLGPLAEEDSLANSRLSSAIAISQS